MDDMIKIAEEYDSAGRIMARAFYDEFQKLAGYSARRGKMKKRRARKASGKMSSGAVHMFMQD